jgi:hypothetical protein
MKRTFDSIIADFKKEAAVDFIGFWELVGTVKTYYEDDESENLQMLTLDLMKRMLSQGFKIGYLSGTGNKLEPWVDQEPDHVAAKIKAEWHRLGHEPTIGDIGWFDYEPRP